MPSVEIVLVLPLLSSIMPCIPHSVAVIVIVK